MKQNIKKIRTQLPSEINTAEERAIFWFFAYPDKEFTFNEICKATNTSKTTAHFVVEALLKKELITKTVLGKLWRIKANNTSKEFIRGKIAYNLTLVYESKIVNYISENYPQARAIILFGSYRKGDDISNSDLDIAVELPGAEQISINKDSEMAQFGYRTNVPVNIHFFSRKSIDLNVFSNIANGIILEGFLEVHPQ